MISCLRDDRLVPPPSGDREVVQAGDAEGGLVDAITLRMPITNDLPRFMRQRCAQRGYGRCGGRRCALHVTVVAGLLLKGTSTEILEISMGSRDEAFGAVGHGSLSVQGVPEAVADLARAWFAGTCHRARRARAQCSQERIVPMWLWPQGGGAVTLRGWNSPCDESMVR